MNQQSQPRPVPTRNTANNANSLNRRVPPPPPDSNVDPSAFRSPPGPNRSRPPLSVATLPSRQTGSPSPLRQGPPSPSTFSQPSVGKLSGSFTPPQRKTVGKFSGGAFTREAPDLPSREPVPLPPRDVVSPPPRLGGTMLPPRKSFSQSQPEPSPQIRTMNPGRPSLSQVPQLQKSPSAPGTVQRPGPRRGPPSPQVQNLNTDSPLNQGFLSKIRTSVHGNSDQVPSFRRPPQRQQRVQPTHEEPKEQQPLSPAILKPASRPAPEKKVSEEETTVLSPAILKPASRPLPEKKASQEDLTALSPAILKPASRPEQEKKTESAPVASQALLKPKKPFQSKDDSEIIPSPSLLKPTPRKEPIQQKPLPKPNQARPQPKPASPQGSIEKSKSHIEAAPKKPIQSTENSANTEALKPKPHTERPKPNTEVGYRPSQLQFKANTKPVQKETPVSSIEIPPPKPKAKTPTPEYETIPSKSKSSILDQELPVPYSEESEQPDESPYGKLPDILAKAQDFPQEYGAMPTKPSQYVAIPKFQRNQPTHPSPTIYGSIASSIPPPPSENYVEDDYIPPPPSNTYGSIPSQFSETYGSMPLPDVDQEYDYSNDQESYGAMPLPDFEIPLPSKYGQMSETQYGRIPAEINKESDYGRIPVEIGRSNVQSSSQYGRIPAEISKNNQSGQYGRIPASLQNEQPFCKKCSQMGHWAKDCTVGSIDTEQEGITFTTHKDKEMIKAATLPNLISRLYLESTGTSDFITEYVDQFLLTYRTFTTAQEILTILSSTYKECLEPNDGVNKAKRLRIGNFLRRWTENHYYDFEESDQLLLKYKNMIKEIQQHDEGLAAVLLKSLTKGKERTQSTVNFLGFNTGNPATAPKSIVPKNLTDDSTVLDIDALEMARQMSLVEFELFSAIEPRELLTRSWRKDELKNTSPNLLRMIDRFNQFSSWVSYTIVREENLKKRASLILKFIKIAKELSSMNNFNGCFEIISGLQQSSIYRLKKTWEIVKKDTKEYSNLEDLLKLTNNTGSFSYYREKLGTCNPPCIPYLGLYQSDLVFIEEGNKDTLENGYINFFKRRLIADVIKEIQTYQHEGYNFAPVDSIIKWWGKQEKNSPQLDEATIYKVSLIIEPRDETANQKKSSMKDKKKSVNRSQSSYVPPPQHKSWDSETGSLNSSKLSKFFGEEINFENVASSPPPIEQKQTVIPVQRATSVVDLTPEQIEEYKRKRIEEYNRQLEENQKNSEENSQIYQYDQEYGEEEMIEGLISEFENI